MTLSVIIITKNNAKVLPACLKSIPKQYKIIVIDDFSKDNTLKIAKKFNAQVFQNKLTTFSSQRNFGFKKTDTDWFIFLDADERITKQGWQEISDLIKSTAHSAFKFSRHNYFSAQLVKHGGFYPDYQTRLFKRSSFKQVSGTTHENYQYQGTLGILTNPVLHFPDRSIKQGLIKSALWTKQEAKDFYNKNHPKITWWRLIKVIIWEFNYRYFKLKGFLDGYIGFVEAITQGINKFFIYQQIWEFQNQKRIQEKTKKLENKLL